MGVIRLLRRRSGGRTNPSTKTPNFCLLAYVVGAVLVVVAAYRGVELYRIGQGLDDLRSALSEEKYQYFAGWNTTGRPWLWFYSAVILLKTPLSLVILIIVGFFLAIQKRYPQRHTALLWIVLPGALYLLLLSISSSQPGIRRLLFLYPLLCIWAGTATASLQERGPRWQWGYRLLTGWYVIETLVLFPHYFSYFNQIVGGPSGGYRYLIDCNSDWGQGLKALAAHVKKEKAGTIYLSYFGGGAPSAYGIHYVWVGPLWSAYVAKQQEPKLDPAAQKKILLAVSATSLAFGDFDFLKTRSPSAVMLDSIFVYDVTHDVDAQARLARNAPPRTSRNSI